VAQIRDEEAQSYQENFVQLRAVIDSKDMKYQALAEQREAEMRAMISIIKIAQQKIDTFQHQMKVHAQTLAMYREREEKAKRSPVIFMVRLSSFSVSLSVSLCLSLSVSLSLSLSLSPCVSLSLSFSVSLS
jgi:ATPase subunit of ABC transporter with duplicated ATPase domains